MHITLNFINLSARPLKRQRKQHVSEGDVFVCVCVEMVNGRKICACTRQPYVRCAQKSNSGHKLSVTPQIYVCESAQICLRIGFIVLPPGEFRTVLGVGL